MKKKREKQKKIKKRKFLSLPLNKICPDQAGSLRRFLAFSFDMIIITLLSICIYLGLSEVTATKRGKPGVLTQIVDAFKEGSSITMTLGSKKSSEKIVRDAYLDILKDQLSPEEYKRAKEMSPEEMKGAFPEALESGKKKHKVIQLGETFGFLQEFIIGYLYFVLFFRFGGRTPGKRLFRLKVIDLKGRIRLRWYQSFERTHGYAASTLFASLGFWQVLWDAEGLTMHDKIARTTVIKLPKKTSPKKKKAKPDPKESKDVG